MNSEFFLLSYIVTNVVGLTSSMVPVLCFSCRNHCSSVVLNWRVVRTLLVLVSVCRLRGVLTRDQCFEQGESSLCLPSVFQYYALLSHVHLLEDSSSPVMLYESSWSASTFHVLLNSPCVILLNCTHYTVVSSLVFVPVFWSTFFLCTMLSKTPWIRGMRDQIYKHIKIGDIKLTWRHFSYTLTARCCHVGSVNSALESTNVELLSVTCSSYRVPLNTRLFRKVLGVSR